MLSTLITKVKPESSLATSWSDEELLDAYCTRKQRGAFEELVRRYERELYSYLQRYLGDAAMAEDAFQATFLQVHLKCHQFEGGRKVRPWLYTIATHQAIDAQRRNKRHRMVSLNRRPGSEGTDDASSMEDLIESRESSPGARLESNEQRDGLRAAVDRLPETLKVAVNLIYYQGLKYREAAEVLGVPVGTVKSRLHSAMVKLSESQLPEIDSSHA